ncbi:M15 family metallopeptidase [Noviherbaspirillum aerium]|uniref:M15 family metallopeptidase n=1 Tax=Noviherbaspirillum aerium TaxID=2588497 RepID=UPI00124F378D|nr:M15 family metallopeptidase [Noviherbaspirillum aerium]
MQNIRLDSNTTEILAALGISPERAAQTGLPFHPQATELALAETGGDGLGHMLIPAAARAWQAMRQAAGRDGIELYIVSAFRDLASQADIVRAKIERGMPLAKIFTLSAPPGYSEHHTGRAVDINTPGCEEREEPFEQTDAFRWLTVHAGRFGFVMSYPRNNDKGFVYEPWHWLFTD